MLPQNVVNAHDQALKKKGTTMRDEITQIINTAMERVQGSGGKMTFVVNSAAPLFTVSTFHNVKHDKADWNDGVIFEEAAVRTGSEDALWKAVQAGRVKVTGGHDDWQMGFYHFPRTSSGPKQSYEKCNNLAITGEPSEGGAQEFFATIDTMVANGTPAIATGAAAGAPAATGARHGRELISGKRAPLFPS